MKKTKLPDVQLTKPEHEIAIEKVGIENLLVPIFVSQKVGGFQYSTAKIDCSVDLAAHLKGISMSRIPRSINQFLDRPLSSKIIKEIAEEVRINLEAENCELTYSFPYFVKKFAPSSNESGLVHYNALFNGIKSGDNFEFNISVEVTTTNLCPCSKEISQYGAHSQNCIIRIKCKQDEGKFIWLEDLINVAETSSSCEIFSILKREDEQYVTEHAYENPMFVEDVVRSCYDKLIKLDHINKFKIKVIALESIHQHNAIAIMSNY